MSDKPQTAIITGSTDDWLIWFVKNAPQPENSEQREEFMVDFIEAIQRQARAEAIEDAARECERHAQFCKDQAHRGGNFKHLIARADEAIYNAQRIRTLKEKENVTVG